LNGKFQTIPAFLGGKIEWGFFVHTLFGLVPPGRYFKAHPEYYSEIDGVRRHVAAQLCLSHPEVLRLATEAVLARMREMPDATLFSVSQMDWGGYCQCAKCRRAAKETGSQSGLFIRFVNAIAERTVREFPDKWVSTLAYSYTEPPPQRPMRLHPNVRVQMCPISTCQIHPFESCGSPQDVRFLDYFRRWSAMTDQLYIWHYATDFAHYYLPLPNLRQLHENVRFYKRHGVRGVFIQANGFSELSDLKGYLMARQLWNPDIALEPVLDEFLPAVYGAAAGEVRAYIDRFQAAADRDKKHHLGCYEPPDHPFYTDAMLKYAFDRLSRGERRAGGIARDKVRLLRSAVDVADLYRRYRRRPFQRQGRVFHNAAKPSDVRRFHAAIAVRRDGGNLPLGESIPLEFSASVMGRWFERHSLVELKMGSQRMFVAPSLGGRILEWHWNGCPLLEPPDITNRHFQYPLSEGYAELAIEPPYIFRGCVERYTARKQSRVAVMLTAELDAGFRMEREIRLTSGGIKIRSTLTNASGAARARQWGSGLHLRLNDWTRLTVDTAQGPRTIVRQSGRPAPAEAVTCERDLRPTGSWRLEFGASTLSASFSSDPVTALIVDRDDSRNRLAIDLRSDVISFAPKQTLTVEQNYRLEQQSQRKEKS
jgi:hypothetical protein